MTGYPPLTPAERDRMRDDFSAAGVERRSRALLEAKGRDVALQLTRDYRKAYWPGMHGYVFWGSVEAWIAAQPLEREELPPAAQASMPAPPAEPSSSAGAAAARSSRDAYLAVHASTPDLPDGHDLSDAAVLKWAGALVERFGPEAAIDQAQKWRDLYAPSSPRAAFWSRVVVQILAPPRARSEAPRPAAADSHAEAPAGPPLRWFEERGLIAARIPPPAPSSIPSPPSERAPEQGRLF